MESSPSVVEQTIVIAAPPERVWRTVTDHQSRARWWAYLDLDPTPGGRFEERWTDQDGRAVRTHGHVLESIPAERLQLSWADDDWPESTNVTIALEATDDGATRVTVRHSGWERLAEAQHLADAHGAGWAMHLRNLRTYVESEPQ